VERKPDDRKNVFFLERKANPQPRCDSPLKKGTSVGLVMGEPPSPPPFPFPGLHMGH